MAGGKGYTFATENEEDMNDWINAFNAALKKKDCEENNQNDEILDKGKVFLPVVVTSFIFLVDITFMWMTSYLHYVQV